MKPLTASELLTVWERGLNQPLQQKTLNLLSLACPEIDSEAVAKLSIGERDARLLLLREWTFGSRLMNMADCPRCSERVEWETNIEDIRLQDPQPQNSSKEFTLDVDDFRIRFRLPNSIDISTVFADWGEQSDPARLLARCILDTHCDGEACGFDNLPDKVLKALCRRIEEEDPQADIRMALICPNCGHPWETQFDLESFFWIEINNWAERLLQTVHKLARAYGWSERDILNMSPVRRQLYLGFVNL
jgi:hypothetical protein